MAFLLLGFPCLSCLCWSHDRFWLTLVVLCFFFLVFAPFGDLCVVLVAFLWLELFVFSTLWWPFCSGCFVSSCVVSGHSNFVVLCVVSWVFCVVSHSDWSSWTVGSFAAALRSHVVPCCGVVALTLLTWCTEFFHESNSCCSFSIIAAASCCGVLLLCLASELL